MSRALNGDTRQVTTLMAALLQTMRWSLNACLVDVISTRQQICYNACRHGWDDQSVGAQADMGQAHLMNSNRKCHRLKNVVIPQPCSDDLLQLLKTVVLEPQ